MADLDFQALAYNTILELSTNEGINASGKDDVYGCVFGRDSAITILKILKACQNPKSDKLKKETLIDICKRALLTLVSLQGKEFNVESGEEPGKFIHEYRKKDYERLINLPKPWFLYPDNVLKNYDSLDSTPLTLIAIYKYWEQTQDNEFLLKVLTSVELGLNWIITYGDRDKDVLLEYEFPKERVYGGLLVQSWTDSKESLQKIDGTMPNYPIAPVETQGYAWLALRLWGNFYKKTSISFSRKLKSQAKILKTNFNKTFILRDNGFYFSAQALDGDKNQINTITANPLLCLWASYKNGSKTESVIDNQYLEDFIKRMFMDDLFVVDAGIRTMSSLSPTFNPNQDSYHNGSFWPVLNGMITEGLENFGFLEESLKLKKASLIPLKHFACAIELYIKKEEGVYIHYCSSTGQLSCKQQAWTAASLLDWSTT